MACQIKSSPKAKFVLFFSLGAEFYYLKWCPRIFSLVFVSCEDSLV